MEQFPFQRKETTNGQRRSLRGVASGGPSEGLGARSIARVRYGASFRPSFSDPSASHRSVDERFYGRRSNHPVTGRKFTRDLFHVAEGHQEWLMHLTLARQIGGRDEVSGLSFACRFWFVGCRPTRDPLRRPPLPLWLVRTVR